MRCANGSRRPPGGGVQARVFAYHRAMVRIRSLLSMIVVLCASAAHAQVFKCVDASGNVTYQQEPCTGGAKGAAVELRTDNAQSQDPADRDGRWRIAAERGAVIPGMPKRWVQQALGQPREIRRGTASEGVAEVWVYQTPRGPLLVGFRTNAVEWSRGAGTGGAGAATGTAAAAIPGGSPPAPTPDAGTILGGNGGPTVAGEAARSRVATDRRCDEVLAELGPASRRDNLPPSGDPPAEAVRYAYEPLPGGLPLRLSFTCIDGRIASVSRDIAR